MYIAGSSHRAGVWEGSEPKTDAFQAHHSLHCSKVNRSPLSLLKAPFLQCTHSSTLSFTLFLFCFTFLPKFKNEVNAGPETHPFWAHFATHSSIMFHFATKTRKRRPCHTRFAAPSLHSHSTLHFTSFALSVGIKEGEVRRSKSEMVRGRSSESESAVVTVATLRSESGQRGK